MHNKELIVFALFSSWEKNPMITLPEADYSFPTNFNIRRIGFMICPGPWPVMPSVHKVHIPFVGNKQPGDHHPHPY